MSGLGWCVYGGEDPLLGRAVSHPTPSSTFWLPQGQSLQVSHAEPCLHLPLGGSWCFGECSALPAEVENSPTKPSRVAVTASSQAATSCSGSVGHPSAPRQSICASQTAQVSFLLLGCRMDLGRPNWLCRTHGHPPCNHLLHLPQCSDPGVLTTPQRTSEHKVQHLLTTGGPSALTVPMQGASPAPYLVLGRPRNQVSISSV